MTVLLRKAHTKDVAGIHALLMDETNKGILLPRSLNQIYTCLRDFFVVEDQDAGVLAGCCALAISWERMAEVRSLFVLEKYRRQGLGLQLVRACLEEAVALGVTQVFSLTYQREFFASAGFHEIPKESLPQKIWTDCIHCPKFPNCDEIAMIRAV